MMLSRLLLVGVEGESLTAAERRAFAACPPGGVILFSRNCGDPQKTRALVAELQELSMSSCGRPLLVAIDQEGGRVRRLRRGFPDFPGAAELGRRGDLKLIERMAGELARALLELGVNCNLAPVLDLDRPGSLVLEERCFGSAPALVSSCGRAYIQGLQDGGVWACAKHFPGHGTVCGDSHELLPVSELGQTALEHHLEPFRAAVAAGIRVMMAGHLRFPGIDGRPVPFSPYFLRSLARSEIGFTGLLLSDDLDMAAVADRPLPEVMVAALHAGLDMALWGRNLRPVSDPLPVMEKFVVGLQKCALPEVELRRRLKRLDLLLNHFSSQKVN